MPGDQAACLPDEVDGLLAVFEGGSPEAHAAEHVCLEQATACPLGVVGGGLVVVAGCDVVVAVE